MDRYYSFPGGLSIEYTPLDSLRIDIISDDSRASHKRIYLPLNDNGQPFIFEENNETKHYIFTSLSSDNYDVSLHVIDSPGVGDKIHISYDLTIDGIVYILSELVQNITSPHDRAFLTRLIEIGRAVRDGTPLPASHGIEGPAPAPAPELRNLPTNATNAITYEPIVNGTNMVNFQGEFDHGRYYKRNTFAQLPAGPNGRKRNPYTQQNIMNTRSYRARIPPQPVEGGRRRKTRRRRRSKKN
jgi:hypothetical protein